MKIGGNKSAIIQIATTINNDIGEDTSTWIEVLPSFCGWLDLSSGDSQSINYNAKIQESTHIFVCDYFPLVYNVEGQPDVEITTENSRMIIDSKVYDILIYDNPMELNQHLEIYLKFVGGQ
ncbi:MAG: hypothetical protein ACERKZ_02435 [Lachnotalea sp.]